MKKGRTGRIDSEAGLALLALIAVMIVLGLIAYAFVSIICTHRYSFGTQSSSLEAFYIGEGALEIGEKYYTTFWLIHTSTSDAPEWADDTTGYYFLYLSEDLGDGTFDLGIDWDTYYTSFISQGYSGP